MLRPVTTRTIGPSSSWELRQGCQPGCGGALGADPGIVERGHPGGEVALADAEHVGGDLVEHLDCVRDRHPDGEAVGERVRAVARDGPAGIPRVGHHGGRRGDDADTESLRANGEGGRLRRRRAARRSRPGRRRPPGARRAGRAARRRSPRSRRTAPARRRPRRTAIRSAACASPSSFASSRSLPSRRRSAPSCRSLSSFTSLAPSGT